MKKNTFFESIYAWLWYYSEKITPINGRPPEYTASGILTVLKFFNGFLIFIAVSSLFKIHYLKQAAEGMTKVELLIPIIIFALFLSWIDDRLYLKRIDIILYKQGKLSAEKIKCSKIIFWCYFILTIASLALFPLLTPDI